MTLKELVRPNIWNLEPYTCARDEFSGEAQAWLDANENSRIVEYNRYPDPLQKEVKKLLGAYRNVAPENIFLGVGSDECIDIAYRVFCRPGIDNVVAIEPTYGMYKVCANVNDVEYRKALLNKDFSLNIDNILNACDDNTKILWICSPNNPTANAFSLDELAEICTQFKGITIVDEAYIDFSPKGSMIAYLNKFPNLIVMQTFSKAWANAAIRLGIAFASTDIINIYNKVKYPYNVSLLTQKQALKVLSDSDKVEEVVKEIIAAREQLAQQLSQLKCVSKIHPSDANFLLVCTFNANEIYHYLCDNGVVVRNRSRVSLCNECLRITVGDDQENALLFKYLQEYEASSVY